MENRRKTLLQLPFVQMQTPRYPSPSLSKACSHKNTVISVKFLRKRISKSQSKGERRKMQEENLLQALPSVREREIILRSQFGSKDATAHSSFRKPDCTDSPRSFISLDVCTRLLLLLPSNFSFTTTQIDQSVSSSSDQPWTLLRLSVSPKSLSV